jgi:peptide/nickel transport system substrate-binding protein
MFKKFSLMFACLFLYSLVALVGCSQSTSTSEDPADTTSADQDEKKVLNIGLGSYPTSIDPQLSGALVERHVHYSIFDTLFELNSDGKIVPGLVDSYELSDDGKIYTLKLKQGIKFHDGSEFNAEAVKFNIERYKEDVSTRRSELSFVESVTVEDPYTVKIKLSDPFSPFISVLTDRSGMMVSPAAVEKYGEDFNSHPVGTGPYVFVSKVNGDNITLKKNENYWKGEVKIDEIVFKVFTNESSKVQNLISGQVDIIDTIPSKEIPTLEENPNLTAIYEPGTGYQMIYVNTQSETLNNKYLRQAVNKAIDRDAIVKVVYDGYAQPANSPFAPSHFAYGESDKIGKPNADEIRELLQKGGKPDGFTFTLQVSNTPVYQQLATVIKSMLKEHNINMEIELIEPSIVGTNGSSGNYEALAAQWSGRPDPDQNIYIFVVTGQPLNWPQISNPELDDLIIQARFESDEAGRKELYDQAMEIIHDEVPFIYLTHKFNTLGVSKNITGFEYISDGIIRTANLDKQQ